MTDSGPLADFVASHVPALEANQARHNLILALIGRVSRGESGEFRHWTLGGPGACAIRAGMHNIVLGELDREQCFALAEATVDLDYPGVLGPDRTAEWFVARATQLGRAFEEPMMQRIHALSSTPRYPGSPGSARPMTHGDADQLADWVAAFIAEAVPRDRVPAREQIERDAASGRFFVWEVDGRSVSMAGITRETKNAAAISLVYTPPPERGRGYAGSVTAATVEAAYARGKTTACLYTDLSNPLSNRCYAKIGFTPVCDALYYRCRAT